MKGFLGINSVMIVNKLSTVARYWKYCQYIGKVDIKNAEARTRIKDILQNFHFYNNTKPDKIDIKVLKLDD